VGIFIGVCWQAWSLPCHDLFRRGIVRKFVSILMAAIALFTVTFAHPALADASADQIAAGKKVFSANCAACHMGGNNVVNAAKTLKSDALAANKMDSAAAIIAQVTNGKAPMPSFKSSLQPDQIEAVAAYVLDQSAKGWK
jgi:cytochrome c6